MSDEVDNRRRAERVPINSEFAGVPTFVSDLSERGVFLHTKEAVDVGTKIELRFTVLLDDPVTIEAIGTVMRKQADPPGVGVQFGPLSPTMVLRINDAVSRMRPRDLGPPIEPEEGEAKPEEEKGEAPEPATPQAVPARASAEVIAQDDEAFQDAKTGAFRPIKLDDQRTVEMVGGHAAEMPDVDQEAFEAETTLFKLKPVDVEIVDDDEPELD